MAKIVLNSAAPEFVIKTAGFYWTAIPLSDAGQADIVQVYPRIVWARERPGQPDQILGHKGYQFLPPYSGVVQNVVNQLDSVILNQVAASEGGTVVP